MPDWLQMASVTDVLSTSVRLSVPIAFAAVGGVITERSGVWNIGLEGMILAGAFGAALGVFLTGEPFLGLVIGILCGMLLALVLAILTITLGVNQVVSGIAINLLSIGLTAYSARLIFGIDATTKALAGFSNWPIPGLADIPIAGPVLFNQNPLVYLLYLLVPITSWCLYRTPWGLNIRATGENPNAADTAGIAVFMVRYICLILSGALAAIGGAYIVLAQVFVFTEHMSAGKGFIALAAIILGRWNPFGAVLAALLFGFCDALQLRLQFANPSVPYQAFVALPYIVSILALVGFYGRVKPPAASGVPYRREAK